jgi:hypothetical protein
MDQVRLLKSQDSNYVLSKLATETNVIAFLRRLGLFIPDLIARLSKFLFIKFLFISSSCIHNLARRKSRG